jgi:hypothetical protein
MKIGINSGCHKDCSDSRFTTTHINQKAKRNIGSHGISQEVYQGVCANYNIEGEVVEKRNKIPVE